MEILLVEDDVYKSDDITKNLFLVGKWSLSLSRSRMLFVR